MQHANAIIVTQVQKLTSTEMDDQKAALSYLRIVLGPCLNITVLVGTLAAFALLDKRSTYFHLREAQEARE